MQEFAKDRTYVFLKSLVKADDMYDQFWMDRLDKMIVEPTNLDFVGTIKSNGETYYIIPKWCKLVKPEMVDKLRAIQPKHEGKVVEFKLN